ncbi:MAG: hypothetical protein WBA97_37205, partial [Actinophytocola sp.]|uniref:alcohol dehydrogenase catalytic domain-containing protein n=1 Tax=Actinophytocola sp. TaxID=1872138 RepID=UPI003C763B44
VHPRTVAGGPTGFFQEDNMIRALVVDREASSGVRVADVAEPTPSAGEVLVDVHHVSLNLGDLNDAKSGRVPPGAVLGSDVAGVVVRPRVSNPRDRRVRQSRQTPVGGLSNSRVVRVELAGHAG